MHANEFGRQRHDQHHQQDGGDDGHLDGHIVVGPADDARNQAAPDREAHREKYRRARQARADVRHAHRAVRRYARNNRDDDPGDRVIEDGGREDQLAEIAPDGADFHQHHRDDLHRRNRQRRAKEQRGDEL